MRKTIKAGVIVTNSNYGRMGDSEPYALAFGEDGILYKINYTDAEWEIVCDGLDQKEPSKIQQFLDGKVFAENFWTFESKPIQMALKIAYKQNKHSIEEDGFNDFDDSKLDFGDVFELGFGNVCYYTGLMFIEIEDK